MQTHGFGYADFTAAVTRSILVSQPYRDLHALRLRRPFRSLNHGGVSGEGVYVQ